MLSRFGASFLQIVKHSYSFVSLCLVVGRKFSANPTSSIFEVTSCETDGLGGSERKQKKANKNNIRKMVIN